MHGVKQHSIYNVVILHLTTKIAAFGKKISYTVLSREYACAKMDGEVLVCVPKGASISITPQLNPCT